MADASDRAMTARTVAELAAATAVSRAVVPNGGDFLERLLSVPAGNAVGLVRRPLIEAAMVTGVVALAARDHVNVRSVLVQHVAVGKIVASWWRSIGGGSAETQRGAGQAGEQHDGAEHVGRWLDWCTGADVSAEKLR